MRHTGIGVIGDVPWGTHFCQFYETSLDLAETLVPYFKAGLEAGEFCMWVTSEPLQVREAEAALRAAVPDLDERVRRGQIEIIDYQDWYFRSGRFSPDEVLKGWVDKLEAALDKGYEGLRLSGNTLWLEPVHWEDFREYEEAVNSLIGRRRHAEELEAARTAAENEKLRLEAVMEALPVGVAITDARGGSITTNSAYERVWAGPRPPTASVKDYAPYKAWWVDSGRPLAPEEWASAQVVEKGEPVVGQMLEIQKFDGSRAFVINSAAPVRDAGGNIAGSAVAIQDITELRESQKELQQLTETLEQRVRQRTVELAEANERLQAEVTYSHFIEADLKQQKETLQTLIDNIPVMLCFYDSEGRAKLTNREFERLLGWSREDAESLDIAPARSREAESGTGTEGLALAGIPGWREHNLRTREGAGLESSWATVRLSDGGQIGIGIDMRERKAAERGRDLVRQIITFSRQKEKERHPSKIGPVVQEALKFLRSMLATTIEIRENIPPEAGYIQADPTQIHQIVMNLANNSAYAMRERGGVLDVRLAEVEVDDDLVLRCPDLKSGPHLKLTVADTGTGMPPEVIDRAFDPFFTTKKPARAQGWGWRSSTGSSGIGRARSSSRAKSARGRRSAFSSPACCRRRARRRRRPSLRPEAESASSWSMTKNRRSRPCGRC